MRLIFAGTPWFAQTALTHLHAAGHAIELVLTQPDRPAGRGMRLQPSPVKRFALAHGIALEQPRSLRLNGRFADDAALARRAIDAVQADAMVVAAYGLILPQWVLDMPAHGCLNVHASLLPRWRGAAPIQRAIEAGDAHTGVTIMQMDAGLDTGAMLLAESVDLAPDDSSGRLEEKLAALGGRLIVQALELCSRDELRPVPQPAAGVTYAHKIDKAESAIDWRLDAAAIERRIRAFDPFPGASTRLGESALKLWRATVEGTTAAGVPAGTVLAAEPSGVRVACGDGGALRVTELQRAGAKRMSAAEFLRGFALAAGAVLE